MPTSKRPISIFDVRLRSLEMCGLLSRNSRFQRVPVRRLPWFRDAQREMADHGARHIGDVVRWKDLRKATVD